MKSTFQRDLEERLDSLTAIDREELAQAAWEFDRDTGEVREAAKRLIVEILCPPSGRVVPFQALPEDNSVMSVGE